MNSNLNLNRGSGFYDLADDLIAEKVKAKTEEYIAAMAEEKPPSQKVNFTEE